MEDGLYHGCIKLLLFFKPGGNRGQRPIYSLINRQTHVETNTDKKMHPECNCYSNHACLQFRVCLRGESLSLGARQACVEDTHTESCGQQTFMSGLPAQLLWFSMQRAEFYVYVLTSPLFGMPAHIMLGIARKCLEFVSSGQITYASSPPPLQVLRHDLYKCGIMVWFSQIEISSLSLIRRHVVETAFNALVKM